MDKDKKALKGYSLCSNHFEDHMFMNLATRRLVWNAVPTLFITEKALKKKIGQMNNLMREKDKQLQREANKDKRSWKELNAWWNFMEELQIHPLTARQVRPYVKQFIQDLGMKPKKLHEDSSVAEIQVPPVVKVETADVAQETTDEEEEENVEKENVEEVDPSPPATSAKRQKLSEPSGKVCG